MERKHFPLSTKINLIMYYMSQASRHKTMRTFTTDTAFLWQNLENTPKYKKLH